jgi:hypothetical protein
LRVYMYERGEWGDGAGRSSSSSSPPPQPPGGEASPSPRPRATRALICPPPLPPPRPSAIFRPLLPPFPPATGALTWTAQAARRVLTNRKYTTRMARGVGRGPPCRLRQHAFEALEDPRLLAAATTRHPRTPTPRHTHMHAGNPLHQPRVCMWRAEVCVTRSGDSGVRACERERKLRHLEGGGFRASSGICTARAAPGGRLAPIFCISSCILVSGSPRCSGISAQVHGARPSFGL